MKIILLSFVLFSISFCQIPLVKQTSSQARLISVAGSIPQLNYDDYNYYTQFQFGTPAQNISLIQDTWVGETWINLVNSTYKLNASTSANVSTTLQTYNYSYGVGTVTGYPGSEVMSIAAINLQNLRIPLLFETNGTARGVQYGGSIGLANFKEYKNWLEVAVQNNLLSDSLFAFDLRNGGQKSFFYAGSSSFPIQSSKLQWFPTSTEHWAIQNISATIIQGATYPQPDNSKQAVWDSGFAVTFIGANAYKGLVQADSIQKYCQLNTQLTLYVCTCNQTYPDLSFTTPSMNFSLLHQNYMFELQGGYCVLSVDTNPETWVPFMVFGEAMFRNYFVAYDKANSKIGFSQDQAKFEEKKFLAK